MSNWFDGCVCVRYEDSDNNAIKETTNKKSLVSRTAFLVCGYFSFFQKYNTRLKYPKQQSFIHFIHSSLFWHKLNSLVQWKFGELVISMRGTKGTKQSQVCFVCIHLRD